VAHQRGEEMSAITSVKARENEEKINRAESETAASTKAAAARHAAAKGAG